MKFGKRKRKITNRTLVLSWILLFLGSTVGMWLSLEFFNLEECPDIGRRVNWVCTLVGPFWTGVVGISFGLFLLVLLFKSLFVKRSIDLNENT